MISVSIITKNEEKNIERCLKSLHWADEIVIVDSGSTDKTLDICKKYNCKIVHTNWLGFGMTKQLGVKNSKNEWILSIDADEVVSDELISELISIAKLNLNESYRIKRETFYLGKKIHFSGWNNDFPLRFFKKSLAGFDNKILHESVQSNCPVKKIRAPIYHFSFPNVDSHLEKIILYSNLGAEQKKGNKKKIFFLYPFFASFVKFFKMYLIKLGFLDGKEGLILAYISSFSSFIKYIKLWLLQKK